MVPPIPLVEVAGTPRDCGIAYGSASVDLIAANTASYMARFATVAGIHEDQAREYGALFRAASHRYAPRVAEMLDGVAEGAGVAVEEIYALNGRTELIYSELPVYSELPGASECTAIGVLDGRTATGHTLLAQNWDWHPEQRPYALLLRTRDERGAEVLALTEAGMLAKAGLNDAGLGVCVNMLTSTGDRRQGGVPYHVLLRAVLDARHLGAAIKVACATPRGASINLLVGQAFPDAPGEVVDLEIAALGIGFRHPADGVLTHSNHFEDPALTAVDLLRGIGSSSFFRAARARRLLGTGPIDEGRIRAVLRDHGGHPQSICRHDEPDVPEADRTETLFSLVLDLDERRMSIAPGPPCGGAAHHDLWIGKYA